MELIVKEEWKDVIGYEGLYQISNLGRVKSIRKNIILRCSNTTTGYKKIELCVNGKVKTFKVHRLVGFAFIPNPENKPNINHKDGNPINNYIENLEWCTQRENVIHGYATGLTPKQYIPKDIIEDMYYSQRLSICKISKILGIKSWVLRNRAKEYGIVKREHIQSAYTFDYNCFIEDIKRGLSNKEIAEKYNCRKDYVGRRRYQLKKGEIK